MMRASADPKLVTWLPEPPTPTPWIEGVVEHPGWDVERRRYCTNCLVMFSLVRAPWRLIKDCIVLSA